MAQALGGVLSEQAARKHTIYFEIDGTGYAVDAAELAGVATACPFVVYPGLPEGVLGLIQWSGKVFPVIDPIGGRGPDLHSCTFLFSVDTLKGRVREIALAVPGTVRVFCAESVMPPPAAAAPAIIALLVDSDGNEALQLKLSKLAEAVTKNFNAAGRYGGKRFAA